MGHDGRCTTCNGFQGQTCFCAPGYKDLFIKKPSLEKRYKKRYLYLLKQFKMCEQYGVDEWQIKDILKEVKKIK